MVQSSKARVQRKQQANAPTHVKRKMVSSHLSKELRTKFGARSARVCVGDTVVVLRGNDSIREIEGKVLRVNTKDGRVIVEGITINQADGTSVERPIHASNLLIVKLNLDDDWRKDALLRKKGAEL